MTVTVIPATPPTLDDPATWEGYNVVQAGTPGYATYDTAANDLVIGSDSIDQIFLTDGNDVVYAKDGNDWIFTNKGGDTVFGGKGNDQIWDTGGDDLIRGDSGNDNIMVGFGGNDAYIGGAGGADILEYRAVGYDLTAAADMTVDLSKGTVTAGGHTDQISGFEIFYANTSTDAAIKGSKNGEYIATGSGDDWIRGLQGADVLETGTGHDTLHWERKDLGSVDTVLDFSLTEDTLDLRGLIKATNYDAISDVVRFENVTMDVDMMFGVQPTSGTMVSVYAGKELGWQNVALLKNISDLSFDQFADGGILLA